MNASATIIDTANRPPKTDWDPASPEVQRDQRAAYDEMRRRCPVAYSEFLGWSLFRHQDVMRVLLDHKTFSNAVSQHLSVPSGIDRPKHTAYRSIIESYFSANRMEAYTPVCRKITGKLIRDIVTSEEVEFMAAAAFPFAAQAQCAFLGWPAGLEGTLVRWTRRNHEATLARDHKAMSELAIEFEAIINDLLETRRRTGAGPQSDLTASLLHEKIWGRPLNNQELASILRNWTVGEIGTLSASIGILGQYLATHPGLQTQLREKPDLIPPAIEEILRIHGPLVSNRRVATRPVEIGGRKIDAGERITLMWIAANRDERVFGDPDTFRLDRDPGKNLLWGAGVHVCPGAPLARLEMRIFVEELLAQAGQLETVPDKTPTLAVYPSSGFDTLPLRLRAS